MCQIWDGACFGSFAFCHGVEHGINGDEGNKEMLTNGKTIVRGHSSAEGLNFQAEIETWVADVYTQTRLSAIILCINRND